MMARRGPAPGMLVARKGFRRINAYKQLPNLKEALIKHRQRGQLDMVKGEA